MTGVAKAPAGDAGGTGPQLLILANDWLELGVNETDGSIEMSDSPRRPPRHRSSTWNPGRTWHDRPAQWWGYWEVRDSVHDIQADGHAADHHLQEGSIIARWETSTFVLTIVRELQRSRLVETVSLEAKVTMTVIDLSIAFRPALTDFLDASDVSVGEHTSFLETEARRSAYHWFAGGEYAHLCSRRSPDVVLTSGSSCRRAGSMP